MNVYAESSAVLAWLLGEHAGRHVRQILIDADEVVSSDLTLVECDRVLQRAAAMGAVTQEAMSELRANLASTAFHWNVLRIGPQIVARARQPFPNEPIRTLDALHVASALHARAALSELALLSLDERIRRVARSLGLPLKPG